MFYFLPIFIRSHFFYFYLFPGILEFWCLVTVTFKFAVLFNNIYRKKKTIVRLIQKQFIQSAYGSGYFKIDAYLIQFLCHMTSDVRFPHMLFFPYLHCCTKALFYEVNRLVFWGCSYRGELARLDGLPRLGENDLYPTFILLLLIYLLLTT